MAPAPAFGLVGEAVELAAPVLAAAAAAAAAFEEADDGEPAVGLGGVDDGDDVELLLFD